jgi:hypothetical protein
MANHFFVTGMCLGNKHTFKVEIATVYLPTEIGWRAITGPLDVPMCPHCHTLAVKVNDGRPLPVVH